MIETNLTRLLTDFFRETAQICFNFAFYSVTQLLEQRLPLRGSRDAFVGVSTIEFGLIVHLTNDTWPFPSNFKWKDCHCSSQNVAVRTIKKDINTRYIHEELWQFLCPVVFCNQNSGPATFLSTSMSCYGATFQLTHSIFFDRDICIESYIYILFLAQWGAQLKNSYVRRTEKRKTIRMKNSMHDERAHDDPGDDNANILRNSAITIPVMN